MKYQPKLILYQPTLQEEEKSENPINTHRKRRPFLKTFFSTVNVVIITVIYELYIWIELGFP